MIYRFKYPKITLLLISIVLAYLVFRNPDVKSFISSFGEFSYLGVFIAGFIFSFGFTAPFAVGFFLTIAPENLLLTAFIGAIGATISNMLIFSMVRFSFKKEIYSLERELKKDIERIFFLKRTEEFVFKLLGKRIKYYLIYIFIGIIIASPLPNEFGDILLAGMRIVNVKFLAFFSFILGFIGIIVLLYI